MRKARCVTLLFSALTGTLGSILAAQAQSAFTYQGQLRQSGAIANGVFTMGFTLYDTQFFGSPITPALSIGGVQVTNGQFTAPLDFGPIAASTDPRWLEISVLPQGATQPVVLSPRQQITPSVRALLADSAAGWTRTSAPSVDQVSPVAFTSGGAYVPIQIAVGTSVGQTFKPSRTDQLVGLTLTVASGPGGSLLSSMRVTVLRANVPLATVDVPISSTAPSTYTVNLPGPVLVAAEESLTFTVQAQGTDLVLRVYGVNGSGGYSRGEIVGGGFAAGSSVDLTFTTIMANAAGTNTLPVVAAGGKLTVRGAGETNSLLVIDSGMAASTGSAIDLHDRGVSKFGLGKTASNDFFLDTASVGRVLTIPAGTTSIGIGTPTPSNRLSVNGSADIAARLGVGGPVSNTAALNVVGSALISGATTVGSLSSATITATSLSGSSISAGSIPSLTPNLAVSGPTLLDNSGNAATDVALRVRHSTNTISSWAIRIENADVATFQGGLRLGSGGFLEATNRAGSGLGTGYARLDSLGNWTAISDERLKTDITPVTDLLDLARALRPVRYRWRSGPDNALHLGFIAQDVDRVAPDLVAHADTLSVDYARTSVIAIGAVQQLAEHVDRLQRENQQLKDRLDRLEQALPPRP